MPEKPKRKRAQSTKKRKSSRTSELEARIAYLQSKIDKVSLEINSKSSVQDASQQDGEKSKGSGPIRGTLPAGFKTISKEEPLTVQSVERTLPASSPGRKSIWKAKGSDVA